MARGNRIADAVNRIADAFLGSSANASGNRLADGLERIADAAENGDIGSGGSGGSSGGAVVVAIREDESLGMKAGELFNAAKTRPVCGIFATGERVMHINLESAEVNGGAYAFTFTSGTFYADSADSYPIVRTGDPTGGGEM